MVPAAWISQIMHVLLPFPCRRGHVRARQGVAQPMDGRVQLPLDGAFREPQRIGDLAELQALMMAHDEHDSLTLRQPVDLRFEHLPELAGVGVLFRSGCFLRRVVQLVLRFFAKGG